MTAVRELSRALAAELGQLPEFHGTYWLVPSTTRDFMHRVDIAVDGALLCRCEDAYFNRNTNCKHVQQIKEVGMTNAESTAIVPLQLRAPVSLIPSAAELTRMEKVAGIILAGGIDLPDELDTPQKVMAVMLRGRALGIDPTLAIQHISIIDHRAVPSAELMGALLERDTDARITPDELTETTCTMRLIWPSRSINETYTVTVDDSDVKMLIAKDTPHEARGRNGPYTTKPGSWILYRRDKLRAHCTKRLLRIYAPGTINGLRRYGLDAGEPEEEEPPSPHLVDLGEGQTLDTETGEIMGDADAAAEEGEYSEVNGDEADDYTDADAEEDEAPVLTPPVNYPTLLTQVRAIWKELVGMKPGGGSFSQADSLALVRRIRHDFPETTKEQGGLDLSRARDMAALWTLLATAQRDAAVPA